MKREVKLMELENYFPNLKKYEKRIEGKSIILRDKIGIEIVIPNSHYCKWMFEDIKEIIETFQWDPDITNMLGIRFHKRNRSDDVTCILGNFSYKKGTPTFKRVQENEGEINHILVRVYDGCFVPQEKLKEKNIKFFRRDKERGVSFFVFPANKEIVSLYLEEITARHKKWEDDFNRLEKVHQAEQKATAARKEFFKKYLMKDLEDFIEFYKGFLKRYGFEDEISFSENEKGFVFKAKEGKFFLRANFKYEILLDAQIYYGGDCSNDELEILDGEELNEIKRKIEEYLRGRIAWDKMNFEETIKLEKKVIVPLLALSEEKGLNLLTLQKNHKVTYKDSYGYDYFGDDDPHDEGWVELPCTTTSYITRRACETIQSLFKDIIPAGSR